MAGSKNNMIPLVLAVILALAAVFAVNRLISQRSFMAGEEMIDVVVATRSLTAGEMILDGAVTRKRIPKSAAPMKAISWSQVDMIMNQKMKVPVSQGDYIVLDDIGVGRGLSDMVGDGEWAVSISLNGGAITNRLRPGDEIAIIGTFSASSENESIIVGAKSNARKKRITTTILPRVRIISISGESNSNIVLALSPEQAQLLIDAQRVASLYPVLRRPGDNTNIDRLKTGMVDSVTYDKLLSGQKRIEVPAIPDQDVR